MRKPILLLRFREKGRGCQKAELLYGGKKVAVAGVECDHTLVMITRGANFGDDDDDIKSDRG